MNKIFLWHIGTFSLFASLALYFSACTATQPIISTKDTPMRYTKFSHHKPKAPQILHNKKLIFANLNPEARLPPDVSFGDVWEYYTSKKPYDTKPPKPLPIARETFTNLESSFKNKSFLVWLGHSSLYLYHKGANILIDPLFNTYASPMPFINRAFKTHKTFSAQDFPLIDIVILTHSHYDHLDKKSLKSLKNRAQLFVVPLNTAQFLRDFGISEEKIIELDWWEGLEFKDLALRLNTTPAQHNTNRLGIGANESLWFSVVLELEGVKDSEPFKLFLSGDGGYYTHFKEIGAHFGGVDLAVMENGQYNKAWKYSHSFPHETLQAAKDLRAKAIQPIHWGRFVSGSHAWNEPVEILNKLAQKENIPYNVPQIGEIYLLNTKAQNTRWYDF